MQVPSPAPARLDLGNGHTLAYHFMPARTGRPTGVVFLGGFGSDMEGTKALALEEWCRARGRAFLRFDYTGHGQSSGAFEDGCIGEWAADALAALDRLTEGPQVLVGSSMGGWIMLLTARERPERVRGLLGIAAAPDFTEDLVWRELTDAQRGELWREGRVLLPNGYDPASPYLVTQKLIEDGKRHLLLDHPLNIKAPVRLIQGMLDTEVPWETALKIQKALVTDDVEIQFVKTGDHRLSGAADIARMGRALDALLTDVEIA